jgi:hypothetical protein
MFSRRAEAPLKLARMTLTIKLDINWFLYVSHSLCVYAAGLLPVRTAWTALLASLEKPITSVGSKIYFFQKIQKQRDGR